MGKFLCSNGNTLYLLRKNDKLYLSFATIVQAALTVIINTLVLVSTKQTQQQKNRLLKTTRLLSIHDISAALFGKSVILVFLNYDIKNCSISLFLSSLVTFFTLLNTGIIVFISFDRLLHVKLWQRYQLGFYDKRSNILLTVIVSLFVLWLIQANVQRFTPVPFVLTTVFFLIFIVIVSFGIGFNLATSIMLRRYKRQVGTMVSCINQRTLRLTQIYTICFAVFKIPYIFSVTMWIIIDWKVTTKALLYAVITIISNLDAVVNAVIFFFVNKEARCYLTKRIADLISRIHETLIVSNNNGRSTSVFNVGSVNEISFQSVKTES